MEIQVLEPNKAAQFFSFFGVNNKVEMLFL